ncbi:MAG: hypothetical protein J5851_05415 [Oscillospiraceae bacterium]|nr:hypothetical protein [Oscillospiraceae bacterium]
MKRLYDYLLAALCLIAGIVFFVLEYPKAESPLVLLVFIAMLLPTIPLTIVFELIHALTKHRQKAEQICLILDILGTALLSAFWFMMILVGGKNNLPLAATSICTNVAITVIVAIKAKIEKKLTPPA